jgi:arylformamidase
MEMELVMKAKRLAMMVLVVVVASGCVFGQAVRQLAPAQEPAPVMQATEAPGTAVQTTIPAAPGPVIPTVELTVPPDTRALTSETRRNVQYYDQAPGKEARSTSLDIYTPGGSGHPVMIYVHGGGWTIGDKRNVDSKTKVFNAAGYVFISLNYRMIPEVDVVAEAQDIARAVAWVVAHATEFGGDAEHIFLMGHSAGCHLVSLMGTDGSYLEAEGLSLNSLKGVVALDTQAYDVTSLMSDPQLADAQTYQNAFGSDPEYWKKVSPTSYIVPGSHIPPFIVAYSGGLLGGQAHSRAQAAESFVQALQEVGVTAEILPAPEKTHAAINQEIGEPGDFVTQAILDFLAHLL